MLSIGSVAFVVPWFCWRYRTCSGRGCVERDLRLVCMGCVFLDFNFVARPLPFRGAVLSRQGGILFIRRSSRLS